MNGLKFSGTHPEIRGISERDLPPSLVHEKYMCCLSALEVLGPGSRIPKKPYAKEAMVMLLEGIARWPQHV